MFPFLKKTKKDKLPARLRGNSCLNCNEELEGTENFCPSCGQRNNINQLSFKLFLDEFFGDIFSYDSRLWGTVFPLILKPGKVAYQFVNGKRKEYVNPFRTYLTVSLLFFLAFGLIKTINHYKSSEGSYKDTPIFNFGSGVQEGLDEYNAEKDSIVKTTVAEIKKETEVDIDSILEAQNIDLHNITADKTSVDSLKSKAREQSPFVKKVTAFYDYYELHKDLAPVQALDSLGYENTFWNRFYYEKSISFHKMQHDGNSFGDKMLSGLSVAIFLFLPIFALFFKLIYVRRKYTYMEHMVFVFYTQSVFFLLLFIFLIAFYVSNGTDNLIAVFLLLFAVYLLLAMKKFYRQGWFKTLFKFLLINFSFIIISTMGLLVLMLISFIFY